MESAAQYPCLRSPRASARTGRSRTSRIWRNPPADAKRGPPAYADSTKLAQAYVNAAPERVVWGSDWPHPSLAFDKKPDDAVLFDLLLQWAPNERERDRILVDNPQTLYGFPKL